MKRWELGQHTVILYCFGFLLMVMLLLGGCGEKKQAPRHKPVRTKTQATLSDGTKKKLTKMQENEKINRKNQEVIQIKEQEYLTQMTDIFTHASQYVGRTVSLEGFMMPDQNHDDIAGSVVRRTPGCCGDDGITGFSYTWDKEVPPGNAWLAVTGVLTTRGNGDTLYFVLEADEVQVKEERGLEFVDQ